MTSRDMKTICLIISCTFLVHANFRFCFGQGSASIHNKKNALSTYVNRPDTSFKWQNHKQVRTASGTYYEIELKSQTWQNIPWSHRLIVYIPFDVEYPNTLLMVLHHIYNRNAGFASLKIISDSTKALSAFLYDVPNQPLFNGKEEDDLQAYTFSQYIKSGDESWPLLFPMVKSVVRAMDVVQLLTSKENNVSVDNFVIAGHSKRGHTAWLTAAADPRVKGIIPIAIDVLNAKAQLPHHLEVFGEYSTPSKDATDFLQELKHPRGNRLIEMVDPYSYKEHLKLPKLIVAATNDQFFATDALNLYWPALEGPKWILYLTNANHVSAYSDPRVNTAAFLFTRAIAERKVLPDLISTYGQDKKVIKLKINADTAARKACIWIGYAKNKDFRSAKWVSMPMQYVGINSTVVIDQEKLSKEFSSKIDIPLTGYMAVFGEVEFEQEGHTFFLSTPMNITSQKKK